MSARPHRPLCPPDADCWDCDTTRDELARGDYRDDEEGDNDGDIEDE